jgi:hypothetical protein
MIYLFGSHSPVFLLRCWPFGHLGFFSVFFAEDDADDDALGGKAFLVHFLTPSLSVNTE